MLKVLQLNCRGYHGNRHLIAETLRSEDPDVALLNDIGILHQDRPIRHYGYTSRSTSTTDPHNGVAILVKSTLLHSFLNTWNYQHFMAVKITTHHSDIVIATTYARPNAGIPYADIVQLFNTTHLPVYLIGDLNGEHIAFNHPRTNPHGRHLHQILCLKNLRFLGPDFHTCFTPNGSGRPDLAFTNRRSLHLHHHMSPGPPCGSDHLPLLLRISCNPISVPSSPHYTYERADWDAFKEALTTSNAPRLEGKHHTAIDDAVQNVHTAILHAADAHIPKATHKIYHDFRPSMRTQRLTVCYRARFQTYRRNPQQAHDLNTLRRHLISSLLQDHGAHWQHLINQTETTRTTNPTHFWRKIHQLRGNQTDRFRHLTINGDQITDPQHVADAFKQHWETIFRPHPLPTHAPSIDHIGNIVHQMRHRNTAPTPTIDTSTLRAGDHLTSPFEEEDVRRLLQGTRRRAPGPAGITWAIARHLPHNITQSLTNIYNASLATGYFPLTFKTATTIFIPKPGKDHQRPENYRPISLLDVTGKTYERLLNFRLRYHLETQDLLTNKQYGFRQGSSTEDALNVITSYLRLNRHFKYAIVTKDIKQAFDTVWHTGLKYKICNNFNLPPAFQRILCNFLTERQLRIKHKNCFSTPITPQAGVPQGSVLSPTLFNMFVNDLPNPSHAESLTIQYADDVTHLTRARTLDLLTSRLQTELTATTLWELKWRILAHPDKTTVTYLNTKSNAPRRIFLNPHLNNRQPIRRTNIARILGISIDTNQTLRQHIGSKAAMAHKVLSNLERFRGCNQRTKMHLYKALIRPTITYCPLALSLAADSHKKKLQRVQNRALRFVHNTHWTEFKRSAALHDESSIPPLNITLHFRLTKQLEKFNLTHAAIVESLTALPPYQRGLRNTNLLLPDAHDPPAPLYT